METSQGPSHRPVLLAEVLAALQLDRDDRVIDCTFGRGGHSRRILECLGPAGRLLAIDRDEDAIRSPEAIALAGDPRFELVHSRFSDLQAQAMRRGWVGKVSAVLMDLGVSSPQLDQSFRGFSFLRDGPLDMRMDGSEGETAAEWLARVPEAQLAGALFEFGEERHARRIARAITRRRAQAPLTTTRELAQLIEAAVPGREPGKHPATRSFQAIRIVINQELAELESGLAQALAVLRPGGRLAVIAFHSLEDRMVKRFLRDEERGFSAPVPRGLPSPSQSPRLRRLGRAIKPGAEELEANVRARSAVLRVAEKLQA